MNYYRDQQDGIYAIDLPEYAAPAEWTPITQEQHTILITASSRNTARDNLLLLIATEESKVTARMLREAAVGSPPAELLAIDATIKAARSKLATASTERADTAYREFEVSPAIYGADPTVPLIPAVTRKETFEEYITRLAKWLEDHKHD